MQIQPRIEQLKDKNLAGMRLKMSLTDNRTAELWRNFMPRRKELAQKPGTDLVSMAIYPTFYFERFSPLTEFERWAAIETEASDNLPAGMESFRLEGGLYAVFHYKGSSSDSSIFQYIYGTWLPGSGYLLDDRPHFEVLGEKYRNNDPGSEEEIWIPVKKLKEDS